MSSTETVAVEHEDAGVVVIRLNRPETLNAFNKDLLWDLHDVFDEVSAAADTRVIVITGAGRGFSAGLDLNAGHFVPPGTEHMTEVPRQFILQKRFTDLFEKIHLSPKPVIAAVNGPATGAGFAIALACDIRVVSPEARFGAPFIKLGASNTDLGISYLLPRYVGAARSAEILLTSRLVDGEEAVRIGLATQLAEPATLMDDALELAGRIAAHGAFQLWMTKETMWLTLNAPSYRHAIDIENRTQIMASMAGDVDVALAAFKNGGGPIQWKAMG